MASVILVNSTQAFTKVFKTTLPVGPIQRHIFLEMEALLLFGL